MMNLIMYLISVNTFIVRVEERLIGQKVTKATKLCKA